MSEGAYTTTYVARISGFSVRQLDYWAHQGILIPSIQRSHGSGSRRLYSLHDVIQLGVIRHLKSRNWSTQKIRKAVATLRDVMIDPNPLKHAILMDGKDTILAVCKTKDGERLVLDALSSSGQQVMDIVLETLEQETLQVLGCITDSSELSGSAEPVEDVGSTIKHPTVHTLG